MSKKSERYIDGEIWSILKFFNGKKLKPVEIHQHISYIYKDNAMNEKQRLRILNRGEGENVNNQVWDIICCYWWMAQM